MPRISESERKEFLEMHIVGKDDCPFDLEAEPLVIDGESTRRLIAAAIDNLDAAADLLSIAFLKETDKATLDYVRKQVFERVLTFIASIAHIDYRELILRIRNCHGVNNNGNRD